MGAAVPMRVALASLTWLLGSCAIETAGLAPGTDGDAGRDASLREAAVGEAGAEVDSPATDAAPPRDAGCGGPESCAAPIDEDCDGIIDEGCDWHFGRPSPLVRLHQSGGYHYSPVLSRDGHRLYFFAPSRAPGAFPGGAIYVAERSGVTERFGAPTPVAGPFSDITPFSFTLDDDEREMIFEGGTPGAATRLYRTVRESRAAAFGPREPLPSLGSADPSRGFNPPHWRAGPEIFFASDRNPPWSHVFRAVRDAPGMPFGEPTEIALGSGVPQVTPMLTHDGLTLFVAHGMEIWAARRASRDDAFGAPVPVADLPRDGNTYFPFVSQETSEIFFVSERPWSPAMSAIWRARICRDGPCDEPLVECVGGVRSPDGRHCYTSGGSVAVTWDAASAACALGGGTLATVHSAGEDALVRTLSSGIFWIGGDDRGAECNLGLPGCVFAWATGEPWIFEGWRAGEPNNGGGAENCAQLTGSGWNDDQCHNPYPYICERELWPW